MGWCSMTPRDKEALERIIECADAINAYVERAGDNWSDDGMAVDAVAKRLEEIGEQAKRITSDTLGAMPDADWPNVKGMRDVIAHDYLDVQVEVVVDVVRDDPPGLRRAACTALGVFGDRRQR
jgi:uncharacterized protein with HEPN domain